MLQLDFSFNVQALKGLVTLEAVDAGIVKAKGKVATGQEGTADKGAIDGEEVA